jgi:hypothetical protein
MCPPRVLTYESPGKAAAPDDRRPAGHEHSATRPRRSGEAGSSQKSRCLLPFNSFTEYAHEPNPETRKKDVVWFARSRDRPLVAFAGIWTEFRATAARSQNRFRFRNGLLTTSPRDQISAKLQNKRQPSIDAASNPPPKSPVSSSQNEVVPHINIRSLRLQPGKFTIGETKRLLQQNPPKAVVHIRGLPTAQNEHAPLSYSSRN